MLSCVHGTWLPWPIALQRHRGAASPLSGCPCNTHSQEFKECIASESDTSKCAEFRDDYMECLHHKKEVRCSPPSPRRTTHLPTTGPLCTASLSCRLHPSTCWLTHSRACALRSRGSTRSTRSASGSSRPASPSRPSCTSRCARCHARAYRLLPNLPSPPPRVTRLTARCSPARADCQGRDQDAVDQPPVATMLAWRALSGGG